MEMSKEDFVREYVEPAARQLADDLKSGKPISDLDRKVLASCGYDADEVIAFYRSQRN